MAYVKGQNSCVLAWLDVLDGGRGLRRGGPRTPDASMSASKLFDGIPVLWINLDRSHERRKTMEAQFQAHDVKNTRIAAVDGKRLFADPVALSSVQLPRDLKNSQGEVREA